MLSNAQKRILSASLMILVLIAVFVLGQAAVLALLFLVMLLTHDEVFCNFIKANRFSTSYFLSLSLFVFSYLVFVIFLKDFILFKELAFNIGLFLCFLLAVYLFYVDMNSDLVVIQAQKRPYIAGLFVSSLSLPMAVLLLRDDWKGVTVLFLFIAIAMDSGAWFVGSRIGKRKLCPTISPKKTVEGFIGGALIAGIIGGIVAHIIWGKMNLAFYFVFVFLGIVSQVGDLIQSKLKRQFNIKDSSSLIPGHGGIYDRMDSLVFLAPVFLGTLKYLGH